MARSKVLHKARRNREARFSKENELLVVGVGKDDLLVVYDVGYIV